MNKLQRERNRCTCGEKLTIRMTPEYISIRCKNCMNLILYGKFNKKCDISHAKMIKKEEYDPSYKVKDLAEKNPNIVLKSI